MSQLSCPKCNELTKRGGFKLWQILVAIFFFPIGIIALFMGRKPTVCKKCGHAWQV